MEQLNTELLNRLINDLYVVNEKNDITIENAIKCFLNHKKITKEINTYYYYKNALKRVLQRFIDNKILWTSQINTKLIESYIIARQKEVKNITINKEIGALKQVLKYNFKIGNIGNINLNIEKLKEIKPKIEIISINDISKILDYLKEKNDIINLVFKLLITTGTRRTELVNIELKNINFIDNTIFLERTKTNQQRYIFIDNSLKELIKNITKNNNKYLLENKYKNKYSVNTISHIIYKIKKDLNIKNLSPHNLRHTFATLLLEDNIDIETIRLLLGHSTYEMTKRYLHIKNEKLKNASINHNPLKHLI